MSRATALLLKQGEPVLLLLPGQLPLYGTVHGTVTQSTHGERWVPIRTTAGHRLHLKGSVFHAPAACVRRRKRGRHAGQHRSWWWLAKGWSRRCQ